PRTRCSRWRGACPFRPPPGTALSEDGLAVFRAYSAERARHLYGRGLRPTTTVPIRTPMPERKPDVAVAGAGIAGLGAALALQDRGFEVVVLEREAEAGGRMRSAQAWDGIWF